MKSSITEGPCQLLHTPPLSHHLQASIPAPRTTKSSPPLPTSASVFTIEKSLGPTVESCGEVRDTDDDEVGGESEAVVNKRSQADSDMLLNEKDVHTMGQDQVRRLRPRRQSQTLAKKDGGEERRHMT